MKKIFLLLILISLLCTCTLGFVGCKRDPDSQLPIGPDTSDTPDPVPTPTVRVPSYDDFTGRTCKTRQDVPYVRPDVDAVCADFDALCAVLDGGTHSAEEILKEIYALEPAYENVCTMYELACLSSRENRASSEWAAEYRYMTEHYPDFACKVEHLYVSAAASVHAQALEEAYFGKGALTPYQGGGQYTDALVSLLKEEAALCASYADLSTATVVLTYEGKTDTADNLLSEILARYDATSKNYLSHSSKIRILYQKEYNRLAGNTYTDLFRVRREIADALGYPSYADFMYATRPHAYTKKQYSDLNRFIRESALPLYSDLYDRVFRSYFNTAKADKSAWQDTVNSMTDVYAAMGEQLYEAWCYMLRYELYSIAPAQSGRDSVSSTLYIDALSAPYLFATAKEKVTDYVTLAYEFGHFAELYHKGNRTGTPDLSEIVAQTNILLTVRRLSGVLDETAAQYLRYTAVYEALQSLLYQGFYARFEELAYALPLSDISRERLNLLALQAAREYGLSLSEDALACVLSEPTVLTPLYTQTYTVCVFPALEIYFSEVDTAGTGERVLTALLQAESDTSLTDTLDAVGLSDPLSEESVRRMLDCVYFEIVGAHYYEEYDSPHSA